MAERVTRSPDGADAPTADFPSGTVTFLFTDIEASTQLVRRLGSDYPTLLAEHHRLLEEAFGRNGGKEVDRQGDALFFAFRSAREAVSAAIDAQRAIVRATWPQDVEVRIRIGIHTGEPGLAETGYHGLDVVRAARISAAAHGGQVLVSALTAGLLADATPPGVALRDLGGHKLKGLERAERIYEVLAEGLETEFPPLRHVEPALPVAGREQELAAAAQAAMSRAPSRASMTSTVRPPAHEFIGRARELDELRATLEEAASGLGRLVLVTGEPGIGKTRLIQELGRTASEQGWRLLAGRCWEEGGAPAYWPWIQLIRAAGGDFERLAESRRSDSGSVDPDTVRLRLFDAVSRFLEEASQRWPLVIALEDLHAADAASLLLLRFLGESIGQSRILILGSYRERESTLHQQAALFGDLVRVARRIPLRGLTVENVEEYLVSSVGEAPPATLAPRLHRITGGNPFFLGEVVRLLVVDGLFEEPEEGVKDPMLRVPEEVRTLIRRRVAGLSPDAVAELRVGAAVGREFELRVLQRLSPLNGARLLDVVTEAVDAGVVVEGTSRGRYAFVHELVRETLYADLPPSRRLELHLEIGGAIEELAGKDLDPHLSEIAHHLALAAPLGDVQKAIDYLVRAGDRSAALLAYEEAALHYGRALELLDAAEDPSVERRGEVLLRVGDARWRAGDANAARSSFEDATDIGRRLGDGEMLARAALGYVNALGGFLLFARFEVGETGAGLLREALAALPEGDCLLRAQLLARLAAETRFLEPVEERLAVSEEAIEIARRLGDSEALVTALHARYWALTTPELVLERLRHTEEMLRMARETANTEMEFLARNARFHCFLELCRGRPMDAEIAAMAAIAELLRQPSYSWHAVFVRAVRATLDGRFADAERMAREALGIASLRLSEFPGYISRFAQPFAIRWAQGRLHELRPLVKEHAERFPWVPPWREALLAAEIGDERAARVEVERHAGRGFADVPRDGLWTLHLCGLAEACVLIDDVRHGDQLYELLLPHAERNAVSYTQQPFGPVALRLGMLARLLERWEEADRHFETALERCELLGAPAISIRVLYERARTLLARGARRDETRVATLLDEASRLCTELELPALQERIEAARHQARAAESLAAVFRRDGEVWTIGYDGETFRLRDVKGLRYIAMLLAQPRRDVHALELVQAAEGVAPAGTAVDLEAADLRLANESAGPVLDAKAREAYKSRLQELGDDLQQARDWNDPERVALLEAEIDTLTEELARATGLGGRDRELPSPAERARVSVTKAIRAAVKAIDRHSPALGSHLDASISTGRFCSYAPPGEVPPDWSL
jgi:class 3 adenylate cyclase